MTNSNNDNYVEKLVRLLWTDPLFHVYRFTFFNRKKKLRKRFIGITKLSAHH